MPRFIPVKILDRIWAEKLLDGEIFMRPLHEFGGWARVNNHMNKQLNNDYRGDINEGTSAIFSKVQDCDFVDNLDPGFGEIVKRVSYVDDDAQFFKVFCLYCLEYDSEHDFFFKPDTRMKEFGDTAVVIKDTCEFIERVGTALFERYKHFTCFLHRVNFFNFDTTRPINCLFEKHENYAYQNELRLAFAQMERNIYALGPDAETAMSLVKETERVTLQIGSIRDIAFSINMDDFLSLRFPADLKLRWPMSDNIEFPTNYDKLVQFTHEHMANCQSYAVKPMLTMW